MDAGLGGGGGYELLPLLPPPRSPPLPLPPVAADLASLTRLLRSEIIPDRADMVLVIVENGSDGGWRGYTWKNSITRADGSY